MPDDTLLQSQPVSDLQLRQLIVEWVPHDTIKPNRYNPNKMTWHDRMLLRQSLLEDGWTQPIVTLPDGTIVDGEQRWTTAGLDLTPADIQAVLDKMEKRRAEGAIVSESIVERLRISKDRLEAAIARGETGCIAAITGGLVPITRVDFRDDAHKMISTIRHNRARGTHQVDAMAGIAADLVQLGLDFEDLETRLGMDDDEIQRLLDSASGLGEAEALLDETAGAFSQAWTPVHLAELPVDDRTLQEVGRSQAAAEAYKAHQEALKAREAEIRQRTQEAIGQAEANGTVLTQDAKAHLRQQVAAALPQPEKPQPPQLKKVVFFVTPEEYAVITAALGERMAAALVDLCRDILAKLHPQAEAAA